MLDSEYSEAALEQLRVVVCTHSFLTKLLAGQSKGQPWLTSLPSLTMGVVIDEYHQRDATDALISEVVR